jgi:hypothetical protein
MDINEAEKKTTEYVNNRGPAQVTGHTQDAYTITIHGVFAGTGGEWSVTYDKKTNKMISHTP